jgi:hypothetical protein
MSSTDTAGRLVQAIDDLLAAAHFSICTPGTEQSYASLVQLHGTVKGLAAVLGLGSPPALEDAALAVHQRTLAGPFVPVRGMNYYPPAAWERQMLSLRAAAEAVRGVVVRAPVRGSVRGEQPATDDATPDESIAEDGGDDDPPAGKASQIQALSGRLVIDVDSQTITFDAAPHRIDHAPVFQFFLAVAQANGGFVSTVTLKKEIRGLAGRADVLLSKHLPKVLRELLGSKAGHGSGYWLRAP